MKKFKKSNFNDLNEHKKYLLKKIKGNDNSNIKHLFLDQFNQIDVSKYDFNYLNFHEIIDLRTQDKLLFILNKIKNVSIQKQQEFIEEIKNNINEHYSFLNKENNSAKWYFSKENEFSWFYIIEFNLLEEVIATISDFAIQMRQCSPFFTLNCEELFNQSDNQFFFEKWKPILISQSNQNKKSKY